MRGIYLIWCGSYKTGWLESITNGDWWVKLWAGVESSQYYPYYSKLFIYCDTVIYLFIVKKQTQERILNGEALLNRTWGGEDNILCYISFSFKGLHYIMSHIAELKPGQGNKTELWMILGIFVICITIAISKSQYVWICMTV